MKEDFSLRSFNQTRAS